MAGRWEDRESGGILRDLGDGLLLRGARPEDAGAIEAFNARVHNSFGGPFEGREPHAGVAAMTRDLISGAHPACRPEDFTVVEDTATGSVVSSAYLIEQRPFYGGWSYAQACPSSSVPTPTIAAAGWWGSRWRCCTPGAGSAATSCRRSRASRTSTAGSATRWPSGWARDGASSPATCPQTQKEWSLPSTPGDDGRRRVSVRIGSPFRAALPALLSPRCGHLALRGGLPRARERRVRSGAGSGAPRG